MKWPRTTTGAIDPDKAERLLDFTKRIPKNWRKWIKLKWFLQQEEGAARQMARFLIIGDIEGRVLIIDFELIQHMGPVFKAFIYDRDLIKFVWAKDSEKGFWKHSIFGVNKYPFPKSVYCIQKWYTENFEDVEGGLKATLHVNMKVLYKGKGHKCHLATPIGTTLLRSFRKYAGIKKLFMYASYDVQLIHLAFCIWTRLRTEAVPRNDHAAHFRDYEAMVAHITSSQEDGLREVKVECYSADQLTDLMESECKSLRAFQFARPVPRDAGEDYDTVYYFSGNSHHPELHAYKDYRGTPTPRQFWPEYVDSALRSEERYHSTILDKFDIDRTLVRDMLTLPPQYKVNWALEIDQEAAVKSQGRYRNPRYIFDENLTMEEWLAYINHIPAYQLVNAGEYDERMEARKEKALLRQDQREVNREKYKEYLAYKETNPDYDGPAPTNPDKKRKVRKPGDPVGPATAGPRFDPRRQFDEPLEPLRGDEPVTDPRHLHTTVTNEPPPPPTYPEGAGFTGTKPGTGFTGAKPGQKPESREEKRRKTIADIENRYPAVIDLTKPSGTPNPNLIEPSGTPKMNPPESMEPKTSTPNTTDPQAAESIQGLLRWSDNKPPQEAMDDGRPQVPGALNNNTSGTGLPPQRLVPILNNTATSFATYMTTTVPKAETHRKIVQNVCRDNDTGKPTEQAATTNQQPGVAQASLSDDRKSGTARANLSADPAAMKQQPGVAQANLPADPTDTAQTYSTPERKNLRDKVIDGIADGMNLKNRTDAQKVLRTMGNIAAGQEPFTYDLAGNKVYKERHYSQFLEQLPRREDEANESIIMVMEQQPTAGQPQPSLYPPTNYNVQHTNPNPPMAYHATMGTQQQGPQQGSQQYQGFQNQPSHTANLNQSYLPYPIPPQQGGQYSQQMPPASAPMAPQQVYPPQQFAGVPNIQQQPSQQGMVDPITGRPRSRRDQPLLGPQPPQQQWVAQNTLTPMRYTATPGSAPGTVIRPLAVTGQPSIYGSHPATPISILQTGGPPRLSEYNMPSNVEYNPITKTTEYKSAAGNAAPPPPPSKKAVQDTGVKRNEGTTSPETRRTIQELKEQTKGIAELLIQSQQHNAQMSRDMAQMRAMQSQQQQPTDATAAITQPPTPKNKTPSPPKKPRQQQQPGEAVAKEDAQQPPPARNQEQPDGNRSDRGDTIVLDPIDAPIISDDDEEPSSSTQTKTKPPHTAKPSGNKPQKTDAEIAANLCKYQQDKNPTAVLGVKRGRMVTGQAPPEAGLPDDILVLPVTIYDPTDEAPDLQPIVNPNVRTSRLLSGRYWFYIATNPLDETEFDVRFSARLATAFVNVVLRDLGRYVTYYLVGYFFQTLYYFENILLTHYETEPWRGTTPKPLWEQTSHQFVFRCRCELQNQLAEANFKWIFLNPAIARPLNVERIWSAVSHRAYSDAIGYDRAIDEYRIIQSEVLGPAKVMNANHNVHLWRDTPVVARRNREKAEKKVRRSLPIYRDQLDCDVTNTAEVILQAREAAIQSLRPTHLKDGQMPTESNVRAAQPAADVQERAKRTALGMQYTESLYALGRHNKRRRQSNYRVPSPDTLKAAYDAMIRMSTGDTRASTSRAGLNSGLSMASLNQPTEPRITSATPSEVDAQNETHPSGEESSSGESETDDGETSNASTTSVLRQDSSLPQGVRTAAEYSSKSLPADHDRLLRKRREVTPESTGSTPKRRKETPADNNTTPTNNSQGRTDQAGERRRDDGREEERDGADSREQQHDATLTTDGREPTPDQSPRRHQKSRPSHTGNPDQSQTGTTEREAKRRRRRNRATRSRAQHEKDDTEELQDSRYRQSSRSSNINDTDGDQGALQGPPSTQIKPRHNSQNTNTGPFPVGVNWSQRAQEIHGGTYRDITSSTSRHSHHSASRQNEKDHRAPTDDNRRPPSPRRPRDDQRAPEADDNRRRPSSRHHDDDQRRQSSRSQERRPPRKEDRRDSNYYRGGGSSR